MASRLSLLAGPRNSPKTTPGPGPVPQLTAARLVEKQPRLVELVDDRSQLIRELVGLEPDVTGKPCTDGLADAIPMPPEAFKAAVEEERAVVAERGPFLPLLSNEQIARPEEWFSARGWRAATTLMSDYLRGLGRPVPPPDAEGGPMMMSTGLVSVVKG